MNKNRSKTQNEVTLQASTSKPTPSTTPFWKLSSGKNGEKYLIFPPNAQRTASFLDDQTGNGENNGNDGRIRVYKKRWFILAVICLINMSNAINWIVYSAIADFASKFYTVSYAYINFLSLVYMIVAIPGGLASFFLIDYFGTRFSINFAGWLNLIGAIIRVLSTIDEADGTSLVPHSSKYAVLMTGQVFCAFAQPFIMFITTKFANNWFAEDQRAIANTLALSSNIFGALIGAIISPLIVDSEVEFVSEMCFLNLITAGISLPAVLFAGFINSSVPPTPPSLSAEKNNVEDNQTLAQKSLSVLKQISKLFKSLNFIILCVCFGFGLGSFSTLTTLIEQITCVRGYDDNDAGLFGGVLILSGIFGSLFFGIIVDKTKKFEEVAKICFCLSTLANIIFTILQEYNNDHGFIKYLMFVSFAASGFFGLALFPICMEMSVECIYPISEDISSGLLFMVGQFFGIFMVIFYPQFGAEVKSDSYLYDQIQKCTSKNSTETLSVVDYSNPLYFQTCSLAIMASLFIIFFKCPYLRLQIERVKLTEEILNSTRQTNYS